MAALCFNWFSHLNDLCFPADSFAFISAASPAGPTPLGPFVLLLVFHNFACDLRLFLIFPQLPRVFGVCFYFLPIDNQMRVKFAPMAYVVGHKFINRLTSDLQGSKAKKCGCSFIYGLTFHEILQANRIILRIINVFVFHMQISPSPGPSPGPPPLVLRILRGMNVRQTSERPNKVKLWQFSGTGAQRVCVCVWPLH